MKLARTITNLAGSEEIQSGHLAEALHATQSSKNNVGIRHLLPARDALLLVYLIGFFASKIIY